MKSRGTSLGFWFSLPNLVVLACFTILLASTSSGGLDPGGIGIIDNRINTVGGILVDAKGVLTAATVEDRQQFFDALQAQVQPPAGDLAAAAKLRMVSLQKLQKKIRDIKAKGEHLSDDIKYLAGLQRVEYVLVYPEENDIVLAGPAEPWTVREDGSVVGVLSGQPTMRLEDLVVALQAVESARNAGGISCSIEPTAEGRRRLRNLLRGVTIKPGQNVKRLEPAMRQAFGPQVIRLNGLPDDSRFAQVLVAADFEMKRLAMNLVQSPLRQLPSYLEMARNQSQSGSTNPRWWMACNYEALTRTEDRMAWRLTGQGIKTMTEIDRVAKDGAAKRTGKVDKTAQRWADLMTENYQALSQSIVIFGELRNVVDLSVVATLIVQEQLDVLSGCNLDTMTGREQSVSLPSYQTPTSVEPQCSFVRSSRGWTVSTSGGVDVNAFAVVEQQRIDDSLADARTKVKPTSESNAWWWNG